MQRCGAEVNGGAEAHCLKVAQRMTSHWETEIFTTCALDYVTWRNHYRPGVEDIDGVKVRRFRVDKTRNIESFNRMSESICARLSDVPVEEQEAWMRAQGPLSSDLICYVKQHEENYDAFIFFSYLYATTYSVLPLVEAKAYLVPLAHNEWPIYLSMWESFFKRPRAIIFNSPEERDFLRTRFHDLNLDGPIAGVAVDPPEDLSGERFRMRYGIRDPIVLYIGRIDLSKGCEELFRYFIEYNKSTAGARKLVMLGREYMPIPDDSHVASLGFVDEQTKWDALDACELLIMPSTYESLSMVLLEAWSIGRAVLVNGRCDVLVGQCKRSKGGLWYTSYNEFEACLSLLLENTDLRTTLGKSGRRYTNESYSWCQIQQKYLDLLSEPSQHRLCQ